jgi:hypothetical protein
VHREVNSTSGKDGNASNDDHLRLHHEGYHQRETALIDLSDIQSNSAGHIYDSGPRHDNDFKDIRAVMIPSIQNEMLSPAPPFQSANIPVASPPPEYMEGLLDTQFRLLREELL